MLIWPINGQHCKRRHLALAEICAPLVVICQCYLHQKRTVIISEVSSQETQALQVFGRRSREGHDFSNSLVETLVGSVPQEVGQVTVSHLVLVVTHLMVHCEEVVHVDLGAHFDPEDITGEVLVSAVIMCVDMA